MRIRIDSILSQNAHIALYINKQMVEIACSHGIQTKTEEATQSVKYWDYGDI